MFSLILIVCSILKCPNFSYPYLLPLILTILFSLRHIDNLIESLQKCQTADTLFLCFTDKGEETQKVTFISTNKFYTVLG